MLIQEVGASINAVLKIHQTALNAVIALTFLPAHTAYVHRVLLPLAKM